MTTKPMSGGDPHRYRGPEPVQWGGSVPIMFKPSCACGWDGAGKRWVTRHQARSSWLVHRDAANAAIREAAEIDRDWDGDL